MITFEEFKKEVIITEEKISKDFVVDEYNSDTLVNLRYKDKELTFDKNNLDFKSLDEWLMVLYKEYYNVKRLLIKSVNKVSIDNQKEYFIETKMGNFNISENTLKKIK